VVVTGLGCVTPLGADVATTWEGAVQARDGTSLLVGLPETLPVQFAAPAPAEFALPGVSAKEARRYDRVILLALAAAHQAVTEAGLERGAFDGDRAGVALGSGIGGVATLLAQHLVYLEKGPRRVSPFLVPMVLSNMPAGVVAIQHGLRGPNLCHVTACATGAHGVGEASRIIERGDADVMVVGGAESSLEPLVIAGFARMQALSTRNAEPGLASRPFDAGRDGFVLGEGAAVLVLEAEEHARARGARSLARVSGYGASGDAVHLAAPDAASGGAVRCIHAALRDARLSPESIDYVNAHATSTPAGDVVEARALRAVFGAHVENLPVSSTKGAMGHLLGAAGAIEALLCVRALGEQLVPPTRNLDEPDPECALDHVAHKARPARLAAVLSNSFGFGGVNAALIFEHPEA
jgi:3-oxoacyl-[acyl-carrier-protein] synthase II